jgi:hypothetical protein
MKGQVRLRSRRGDRLAVAGEDKDDLVGHVGPPRFDASAGHWPMALHSLMACLGL